MSWRPEMNQGDEVGKCRWDIVPYMRGLCLDLGCGPYKAFPHFTGCDSGKDRELFGIQFRPQIEMDVRDLSRFSSGSYDCVFSSHTLEHIEDWKETLKEWWRVVKQGGYLILYLPHKDFYPRCGKKYKEEFRDWLEKHKEHENAVEASRFYAREREEAAVEGVGLLYAGTPFANPDHKHDFSPQDIVDAMKANGGGFDLVECEERNGGDEYSFWLVFKKISKGVVESWKKPKPLRKVAVVRYGAIGDNIQASSILPWFKENGYHVTFYCQAGQGFEAIKHDPNIDRFIVQEKDAVPPQVLGEFWEHERKKYDKWVNLCESVEGTLLACPDRAAFEWPNEVRAKLMDHNYLEFIHALADVPAPYWPRFYSTPDEKEWAKRQKEKFGGRCVLWSLAGSSGHKMWPHLDSAIAAMMLQYKDVQVVLVGDESCEILEQGWEKEKRVHRMSGKWTIRESLAFTEVADLVIGTETGLLNAAGCMDVPKIINLSHSSEEMLTKHWKKTIVLKQPRGVGCPKSPCRQLHGSRGAEAWKDCPQHEETGASLCQFHISPEAMWGAIQKVLGVPMQRVVGGN